MKYRIVWYDAALADFKAILQECKERFGFHVSNNVRKEILGDINLLRTNPKAGYKESELKSLTGKVYRSLVISPQTKIVYTTIDCNIYIVLLWNTRRNPEYLQTLLTSRDN